MTFNPAEYPANWPELRTAVQARAGDRCERCGVLNHALKYQYRDECYMLVRPGSVLCERNERALGRGEPSRITKVVCTTAHKLGTSKLSQDINDLEFLCQRCHLNQDRPHHLEVQRQNRDRKRGQLELAL